ncbi:MAG: cellulase family glycosylhydrolase [Sporocytophaga sp.]|uniref:cellulase family glycosylhydrolase n=1 Tax=Sporocytophaga sp. TaxID=2231183 RepID=UPI001B035504|nr:cellulase family glycosylhydrolase [Sporocytophaga sp.]MBO9701388.1 cellulase family glycosylhydrolase [Sporocytophaga sp.]
MKKNLHLTFSKALPPVLKMMLISAILFAHVHVNVHGQTFVEQHGQLRVQGNKIVDKNGAPVQLRGMSLYWSQWLPKYYTYNTVKWLRDDWCINVIRIPMAVSSGGYETNPTAERNKVITVVDAAISLGIYVIIDFHEHGAQNRLNIAKTFFADMSQRYGNQPNVLYETFNEPLDVSWASVIKPYHEQVISTIRQYDPDNIIICGTRKWSQEVVEASLNPINGPNIAYTLHYYAASHKQWLRNNAQTAMNNGIALFVTEYGTTEASGDGTVDAAESRLWWDFLNKNSIGHCNWSVADISESSAALYSGASPNGGWTASQIKPSGTLVRNELKARCGLTPPPCTTSAPVVTTSLSYCQNAVASPIIANGTSLKWYTTASGGTGSAAAPTPSTATAGSTTYYVSQTLNGCEGPRAAIAVTVNPVPSIVPYVQLDGGTWLQQNTAQICQGGSLKLGPQPGTTTGWSWSGPNGFTSGIREVSLTPISANQGGVYTSTYTSNGCSSTQTFTITVNSFPKAEITASGPTTFVEGESVTLTANAGAGLSYNWFKDLSQIGTSASIIATTSGSYTVDVTNASLCRSTSAPVTVNVGITTGIHDIKELNSTIYPNPATGDLNLQMDFDLSDATIQLTDALGQKVQISININGGKGVVDVSSLPDGSYFLVLRKDDQFTKKKITVMH